MAIVTLTTDLGLKDHYVGVVKGSLLKLCPEARIIDISHNIEPYNIIQAAFTLKNAYKEFPEGSIHIIGVNPEADLDATHLVIKHNGHYFIGADNGVFSLILEESPDQIIELNINPELESKSFPTKDIFAKAAAHLAKGGTLEMIGSKKEAVLERSLFQAVSVENFIKGMVLYIDHYGNILTNIEEPFFKAFGRGRDFSIEFRQGEYNINRISKGYSDVPEGEKLALFSSSKLLEIAMNKGNASRLLGLQESDSIRIEFYDR